MSIQKQLRTTVSALYLHPDGGVISIEIQLNKIVNFFIIYIFFFDLKVCC